MIVRAGRFHRLNQIRQLDPTKDYHAIYRLTALYEFPFEVRMGLLLAFWRTFAVPSIAELLAATGETTTRTARRADDTGILMYELIDHGLDHPRGRMATRRLNQIHRRFTIRDDDYRYVLGTLVFVGQRQIDRYGWRPLCCHERQAMYEFYSRLGRRLGVHDIPSTATKFKQWYDQFEAHRFARTDAAVTLMAATKGMLAELPRPLVPAGRRIADALLDAPLRAATGLPDPPLWARAALGGGLRLRARLLRHLARPRAESMLAAGLHPKTYPDGYDLASVGPTSGAAPSPRVSDR